jgi:hypothetical protein
MNDELQMLQRRDICCYVFDESRKSRPPILSLLKVLSNEQDCDFEEFHWSVVYGQGLEGFW